MQENSLLQFYMCNLSLDSVYPFKIIVPLNLIFWLPLQVWSRNEQKLLVLFGDGKLEKISGFWKKAGSGVNFVTSGV